MYKRLFRLCVLAALAVFLLWLLISYIPGRAEKFIYQTGYEDLVLKYSEEFGADPALVYSVIKVESNFDPKASSEVGAIGLMQIIEDSFDWVALKLGRNDLSFEDMYQPEYSVMFGCYMIGYLYDRYSSVELTAAAYHSGMGTVDGWIASGEVPAQNASAEDFPGKKTSHYVGKIVKAYEHYSNILHEKGID